MRTPAASSGPKVHVLCTVSIEDRMDQLDVEDFSIFDCSNICLVRKTR